MTSTVRLCLPAVNKNDVERQQDAAPRRRGGREGSSSQRAPNPERAAAVPPPKFDVGGKLYKVSRALIDEHSRTVLGKLVSDTWNEDPEETVFIDRDGDIFAHVLNFLRYGR